MSRQIVIGIAGLARAGKDTVGQDVVLEGVTDGWARWNKTEFADPLKRSLMLIYDLTYEQMYGDLKEVVDPRWGLSPRVIAQRFGTEVARQIHTETWIYWTQRRIVANAALSWVVSDLRFVNEAEMIRHDLGGQVWWVDRPDAGAGTGQGHVSENSLHPENYPFDDMIANDGSLAELRESIRTRLADLDPALTYA